jgi:hypothetical protein
VSTRALRSVAVAAAIAWLAIGGSVAAHHSVLPFDNEHGTTLDGVVTRVRWQYPHVTMSLEVSAADGAIETWAVESESPNVLARLGWTRDSIAVGRHISVLGAAAKDGSPALRCKAITLADGRVLSCFAG